MDILIIIAIFYALPQIFKKITQNNKGKSGFNFEDLNTIKKELVKIRNNTSIGNQEKESKIKLEKAPEQIQIKAAKKELSDADKEELAVYTLDKKYTKEFKDEELLVIKNNIGFKSKSELRKAIIMSEILGKPRAIKKIL